MARPPKFIHPIRKVRETLAAAEGSPITQTQFGARIGYSGSYIQRIELGQVEPPDRLCRAIAWMTGVDRKTLTSNDSVPKMLGPTGKERAMNVPVSVEAFREWKATCASASHEMLVFFRQKNAEISLASLCLAAGPRAEAVLFSFSDWLVGAVDEFNLRSAFDREYSERWRKWNSALGKGGVDASQFSELKARVTDELRGTDLKLIKKALDREIKALGLNAGD